MNAWVQTVDESRKQFAINVVKVAARKLEETGNAWIIKEGDCGEYEMGYPIDENTFDRELFLVSEELPEALRQRCEETVPGHAGEFQYDHRRTSFPWQVVLPREGDLDGTGAYQTPWVDGDRRPSEDPWQPIDYLICKAQDDEYVVSAAEFNDTYLLLGDRAACKAYLHQRPGVGYVPLHAKVLLSAAPPSGLCEGEQVEGANGSGGRCARTRECRRLWDRVCVRGSWHW